MLPEREFGVRKKVDGVAVLGGKRFEFKHPKRVGPAGKKLLRDLAKRERQLISMAQKVSQAEIEDRKTVLGIQDESEREQTRLRLEVEREAMSDTIERQHRELTLDHLGVYLGDAARAELASDEDNYPADELVSLLKFIIESKAADQEQPDPLGGESQARLTGTSSLPV